MNKEGVFIGIDEDVKSPVFVDFEKMDNPNTITIAKAGSGMCLNTKMQAMKVLDSK